MSAAASDGSGSAVPLVVSAMSEESAGIRAAAEELDSRTLGGIAVGFYRVAGTRVAVARTGDGWGNAGEGLARLLDALAVSEVLAVGVGGALTPDLDIADLVVGERVVDEHGAVIATADPARLRRAVALPGARAGTILSASRVLVTAAAKRRAREAVGADGPASVDLESAPWAAVCRERRIPILVARAMSDVADEDLPLDFNRFLDDRGAIRRAAIARHLVLRPGRMQALLALRDRLSACAERLARHVEHVLSGR